ncbi:MAG: hypothetical protein JWO98_5145 [Frankiales bacterium]|nr:hypothetical protein [Frankiales bacterium]
MSAFKITLLAPGVRAEPKVVGSADITEELRQVGLEWKLADFFHDKAVVLIIEPFEADAAGRIAELEATIDRIREATDA